jgi:hypothetical protein
MYGLNHWSNTGWRGPLLFSTVQISHFQVEVAQTKWHHATATLALWTGTERTVMSKTYLLLALGHQS